MTVDIFYFVKFGLSQEESITVVSMLIMSVTTQHLIALCAAMTLIMLISFLEHLLHTPRVPHTPPPRPTLPVIMWYKDQSKRLSQPAA